MIGWLKSRAHCSYSTIATWMDDVLQIPVPRGYLAKLCNGIISTSLAAAHEQLKQAIPRQPHLGSDESSLKNNGKKHWIWCITAPLFTLFHIASTRSRSVLEELIGTDYDGAVHFDYFSANCSFATCGKQGRSFFHFLHESVTAVLSGGKLPQLLPE